MFPCIEQIILLSILEARRTRQEILRKIKKKGMSLPDFLFMDILPLIASILIKHYLSSYA
jgi:hypothetical protein